MLYGTIDVARNMVGLDYDRLALRKGEFKALDNVSFELKRGEALGIIGQNGSGKTTLLRLLNGIFPPDSGRITIRGRMGALIAVGAGFHPHMTGRQNIYLNGTIIGMSRKEIDEKFDEIVAFADIGEFMDAPVSTYSSGMTVRLGFSIAIHASPEILLADEVLAVGDLNFALKCYRKISEYREKGGSLILVSHGLSLVRNTCQRVMWLDRGRVIEIGPVQEVCDRYEKHTWAKNRSEDEGIIINHDDKTRITGVEFLNEKNKVAHDYVSGQPFTVRIRFNCKRKVAKPVFSVTFVTLEDVCVVCDFSTYSGLTLDECHGKGYVDYHLDALPLKPGEYHCLITFSENGDINNVLEWHNKTYRFIVTSAGKVILGLVDLKPSWHVAAEPDAGSSDGQ
jgi:lipopolysaccharide transport system ATP-binding protein